MLSSLFDHHLLLCSHWNVQLSGIVFTLLALRNIYTLLPYINRYCQIYAFLMQRCCLNKRMHVMSCNKLLSTPYSTHYRNLKIQKSKVRSVLLEYWTSSIFFRTSDLTTTDKSYSLLHLFTDNSAITILQPTWRPLCPPLSRSSAKGRANISSMIKRGSCQQKVSTATAIPELLQVNKVLSDHLSTAWGNLYLLSMRKLYEVKSIHFHSPQRQFLLLCFVPMWERTLVDTTGPRAPLILNIFLRSLFLGKLSLIYIVHRNSSMWVRNILFLPCMKNIYF